MPEPTLVTKTMTMTPTPRSQFSWAFRMQPPPDPPSLLAAEQIARRLAAKTAEREKRRREERVQRIREQAGRRQWIEDGNDLRQPPEYRGTVFEHADNDGVHASPFPPYQDEPQGGIGEAFMTFQAYNQTRYETHPEYYCRACTIRFNARDGGLCGPCIGNLPPEYPL